MIKKILAGNESLTEPAIEEKVFDIWMVTNIQMQLIGNNFELTATVKLSRILESGEIDIHPTKKRIVALSDLFAKSYQDNRYLDWLNSGINLIEEEIKKQIIEENEIIQEDV